MKRKCAIASSSNEIHRQENQTVSPPKPTSHRAKTRGPKKIAVAVKRSRHRYAGGGTRCLCPPPGGAPRDLQGPRGPLLPRLHLDQSTPRSLLGCFFCSSVSPFFLFFWWVVSLFGFPPPPFLLLSVGCSFYLLDCPPPHFCDFLGHFSLTPRLSFFVFGYLLTFPPHLVPTKPSLSFWFAANHKSNSRCVDLQKKIFHPKSISASVLGSNLHSSKSRFRCAINLS